jgi:Pla-1/cef family extracellular lipase
MKKLVLSLSIASALSLTGCGGGDSIGDIQNNQQVTVPASRVVFDPANGAVSVPNDLLFSGTVDGTLEMPGEATARANNQSPDYSDPQTALGVLDGWSTQHPFTIALSFPSGYSLDSTSASTPGAVRIFEVEMGGSLTDADCATVTRGLACKVVRELQFGTEFVTSASGDSVAVAPLAPLKAKTSYILALTNTLKDSASRAIEPSSSYGLVKQDINTHPLGSASQLQLQATINSYETALASAGMSKEDIIYSAAFTTQSVSDVLLTVKTLMAASLANGPQPLVVQNTGVTVADALVAAGRLDPVSPTAAPFMAAQLYQGQITVPYYSATPTVENPTAPTNTSWKAACDSAAIISAYAAQSGDSYPYDPASTQPISQNDGYCLAASSGRLRDLGLDSERHLTKFNTLPKLDSMQPVDVQMTVPNLQMVNGIRQQLGLPTIEKPATGWPVVILQHGITSKKEDMLSTTGLLTLNGFATAGIDLPLHSSRGFDLNMDGQDEINASTVSPTHYINLANLPTTRDNVRQGISDMLALRLGLNFTAGAEIDGNKVYTLGLSLGAISASSFVGVANTPNLEAATGIPGVDNYFKVRAVSLSAPGGGLASLLLESKSFGPLIQGSLLSAAGGTLSDEFNQFLQSPVDVCAPYVQIQDRYVGCQMSAFLAAKTAAGAASDLAEISALLSRFAFAAQTVTDAGDPNNYASLVVASQTPVLLSEIVGDVDEGGSNLSDQVIPNQTQNVPNGGTEPLIRALQLPSVTASVQGEVVDGVPAKVSGVVRFKAGHHASIIDPSVRAGAENAENNARTTQEMQQQSVGYFLTDGVAIPVTDTAVVKGAN